MKHADKIRADFEADPEAKHRMEEAFRKMRPNILRATALYETMFPPESPTSRRRGGNKLAPSPQFMDAVCFILNARMGFDCELAQSDFDKAMKNADPEFFRMMAEAAQYVQDMPHADSLFAKHVIAARRIAADMMGETEPLPSWREVREEVADQLGQAAYGETSRDWGRVRKAADLSSLPD